MVIYLPFPGFMLSYIEQKNFRVYMRLSQILRAHYVGMRPQ